MRRWWLISHVPHLLKVVLLVLPKKECKAPNMIHILDNPVLEKASQVASPTRVYLNQDVKKADQELLIGLREYTILVAAADPKRRVP
jgi:hypothetical protein